MDPPRQVTESDLFVQLAKDDELRAGLTSMRSVVASLAETTSRTIPHFTDDTVCHMDALWAIAECVLTPTEISRFTPAEAFLLGASFYLHDIGMAYVATEEGLHRIKQSSAFRGFIAALPECDRNGSRAETRAITVAVRQLHADAAIELATQEIPGASGRYLFEALSFRDTWTSTCGAIASSHHWTIAQLDDRFSRQGDAPLPGNRKGDLLYVAACLRLIDYQGCSMLHTFEWKG